jgi:alanine racemase
VSRSGTALRHRAAWLEIDLAALRHNVGVLRSLSAPAVLAPVVKANAYGHGLKAVAGALRDVVEALCVATLDEAIELRAVVGGRVIVLYAVPPGAAADAVASGAELTVMAREDLPPLLAAVPSAGPPLAIHLAVETGLGRGGLTPTEAAAVAGLVAADPRTRLAGLWSHLATPEDPAVSGIQVARFEQAVEVLRAEGIRVPDRHLAASGSLFTGTAPGVEMVRPGLAVYGVLDEGLPMTATAAAAAADLQPVLSLKAQPVAFGDIAVGGSVGYGGRWRATRPTRIAILPVGYADGYLRGSQPGATALVRGASVPLVGVISMDALAVDVTDVPGVSQADEFVLLGRQGQASITAGDLARWRNTIAWEVLSSMAARLDRVYYPEAGSPDPNESPAPCQT